MILRLSIIDSLDSLSTCPSFNQVYIYTWHIFLSAGFPHICSLFCLKMMLFLLTIVYKCGCEDECWLNSYFHIAQCEDSSWLGYSWAFEWLTATLALELIANLWSLCSEKSLPLWIAMYQPHFPVSDAFQQSTAKLCLKLGCSTCLKLSFWHNCWQFPHFATLYNQGCQQQFHDLLVLVDL